MVEDTQWNEAMPRQKSLIGDSHLCRQRKIDSEGRKFKNIRLSVRLPEIGGKLFVKVVIRRVGSPQAVPQAHNKRSVTEDISRATVTKDATLADYVFQFL